MLPDYWRSSLEIVFVGLNPGTYSDRMGHYFARRTNLFWTALYESGLVTMQLTPCDDIRINEFGFGLTDMVPRATANVDAISATEFKQGGVLLRETIVHYSPCIACFVGIHGFRRAYDKHSEFGAQLSPRWGDTYLFIVPSTSPRNVYYRPQVIDWFERLKQFHQ